MFDRISGVYDRMNRIMTAGLDRTWRARAAERSRLAPGESALDLCCGTGDVALAVPAIGCEEKAMSILSAVKGFFAAQHIRDAAGLRQFMESRSAYLVQKSITEYIQARANVLFCTLMLLLAQTV